MPGSVDSSSDNVLLVTCVKDEGPYLLEWIAYHRLLGFDRILILTNDLEDGSEKLLEILRANNVIVHSDLSDYPLRGRSIQNRACDYCMEHPLTKRSDWVFLLDVDEFLYLERYSSIHAFLRNYDEADAVVFNWVNYGADGLTDYADHKMVLQRFQRRGVLEQKIKSIARVRSIDTLKPHIPKMVEGSVIVNVNGKCVGDRRREHEVRTTGAVEARINHYIVKSMAEFCMRHSRGRCAAGCLSSGDYKYSAAYFERNDRSLVFDPISDNTLAAVIVEINNLMTKYGLSDIVKEIGARYLARLDCVRKWLKVSNQPVDRLLFLRWDAREVLSRAQCFEFVDAMEGRFGALVQATDYLEAVGDYVGAHKLWSKGINLLDTSSSLDLRRRRVRLSCRALKRCVIEPRNNSMRPSPDSLIYFLVSFWRDACSSLGPRGKS